ncbi:hypothetical protein NP233_g8486 [Leucocoprinus birnbaumii]|uniref:Uncharacterized protein n=1 Tax=Leucocoprinus birnbaumii TaxID=56174 RepID=A0AAD5VSR3_9AGAR|nr:hypothetical protein NP233_g8486 [Leucocoprinus birnbaumii]
MNLPATSRRFSPSLSTTTFVATPIPISLPTHSSRHWTPLSMSENEVSETELVQKQNQLTEKARCKALREQEEQKILAAPREKRKALEKALKKKEWLKDASRGLKRSTEELDDEGENSSKRSWEHEQYDNVSENDVVKTCQRSAVTSKSVQGKPVKHAPSKQSKGKGRAHHASPASSDSEEGDEPRASRPESSESSEDDSIEEADFERECVQTSREKLANGLRPVAPSQQRIASQGTSTDASRLFDSDENIVSTSTSHLSVQKTSIAPQESHHWMLPDFDRLSSDSELSSPADLEPGAGISTKSKQTQKRAAQSNSTQQPSPDVTAQNILTMYSCEIIQYRT